MQSGVEVSMEDVDELSQDGDIDQHGNDSPAHVSSLSSLAARVRQIRANTISSKSRQKYRASQTRYLAWLINYKPQLVCMDFAARVYSKALTSDIDMRDAIQEVMKEDKDAECPPIFFELLDATDFIEWLMTLEGSGGALGFSTYNGHRSALYNLFHQYKRIMSTELSAEMSTHFRGLKRDIAKKTANGVGKVKIGKDPLSFELYEYLCTAMHRCKSSKMIFFTDIHDHGLEFDV